MKKILVFLLLLAFIGCNTKLQKQIEAIAVEKYNDNDNSPKLKISINLDSLKNVLLPKDSHDIILDTPHIVKYNKKYKEWLGVPYYRKLDSVKGDYRWRLFYLLHRFGKYSLTNHGAKNQIGYQVYGKEKDILNEVHVSVNIYTPYIKEKVLLHFFEKIKEILETLRIELPKDLKKHIIKGNLYYFENEQYYLMTTKPNKKTDYEPYNFIIKSK